MDCRDAADPEPPARPVDPVLEAVLSSGADAMAFTALESGMRHWRDDRTGAVVAYVDTGSAWVAACAPLVAAAQRDEAAARFVEAARAAGRRASFFGTESMAGNAGGPAPMGRRGAWKAVLLGEQPLIFPDRWLSDLARHRRVREQLRRARAKGVVVRRASGDDVAQGRPLRARIDRLAAAWLASRRIEPLAFLAAVEPFRRPEHHVYVAAEQGDRLVGFLSAVPAGARGGWLVEDVFRAHDAPNGTTEAMLHALLLEVRGARFVTLGLTALAGPVSWPLRGARWLSRPLYDFAGLRAFRDRVHPHAWESMWLVHPAGEVSALHMVDALRAFAGGSLAGFALRSVVRHPSGLPWSLALPLPLWTATLAWLLVAHRASLLGFPRPELALWTAFDALLLLILVRAALRPRVARLVLATGLAAADAVLSIGHLAYVGLGTTALQGLLRATATGAPIAGALLLAWAAARASAAPWREAPPIAP